MAKDRGLKFCHVWATCRIGGNVPGALFGNELASSSRLSHYKNRNS